LSDVVFISNLRCDAILGVLPDERTRTQPVVFNLELQCDTRSAAHSGSLDDTIDYAAMAERVIDCAVAGEYRLVETLAEDVADMLLSSTLVDAVTVEVCKPEAVAAADGVGVRIYRPR